MLLLDIIRPSCAGTQRAREEGESESPWKGDIVNSQCLEGPTQDRSSRRGGAQPKIGWLDKLLRYSTPLYSAGIFESPQLPNLASSDSAVSARTLPPNRRRKSTQSRGSHPSGSHSVLCSRSDLDFDCLWRIRRLRRILLPRRRRKEAATERWFLWQNDLFFFFF